MGAHICQYHAGGQTVDPDVAGAQLFGQRLGQADDRGLGGGVADFTGSADLPPHGRNVDDTAAAVLQHSRQYCVDAVIHAVDIDGEHPVPMFLADLGNQAEMGDTGVVDQHIHRGKIGECGSDRVFICHIAANGFGAGFSGNGPGGFVILFIEEADPMAPGGKVADGFGTDTAAAAGNHDLHGSSPL